MNVIFLDIDGVLQSTSSAIAFDGIAYPEQPETWNKLNPVSIGLLRNLVRACIPAIVLTSTWKTSKHIDALEEYLAVGKLRIADPKNLSRGEDIMDILYNPSRVSLNNIEYWVSLDDMFMKELENDLKGRQITIPRSVGFSADAYYEAFTHLCTNLPRVPHRKPPVYLL